MITVNLTEIEMMTMLAALNSHVELELNEVDKKLCERLDNKLRDSVAKYFLKKGKSNDKK